MSKEIPKVPIDKIKLEDNYYENYGKKYSALKLIEHSKQYKLFDMPLIGIDLTRNGWEIKDLDDFIYHLNRVNETDLKYPIILDNCGVIADGLHRVCKAISKGETTIKAIRLETMPTWDSEVKEETK